MTEPHVYVLHLDPPLAHARHYVGIALDGDVLRRLRQHISGQGSPLVAAAVAAGCQVRVVLDVPGDRRLERRWHHRHGTRLCPECGPRNIRIRHLRLPFAKVA